MASIIDWPNPDRRDGAILVVSALLFLFPLVSAGGYSSSIYNSVVLVSLFFCWSNTHLTVWEKWLSIGMVLVFLTATVSLFESQSLYEGYKALGKPAHFLFFIPAYLFIRRQAKLPLVALLSGFVLASLVFVVIGYFQRYHSPVDAGLHLRDGVPRAQGSINPIMFGQLSVVFAFLQIAVLIVFRHQAKIWLLVFPIISAFIAAYFSGTRGALSYIPIATLLLIWVYKASLGRAFTLSILGVFLFGLAIIVVTENPLSKMFITGINELMEPPPDPYAHRSWGSRVEMWRNSFEIFSNHPFIGTGLGDFHDDMKALVDSGFSRSKDPFLYAHHSHSIYFQALAMTGGLGLLALVFGGFLIPALFFHFGWRQADNQWRRFAALGGILTVFAYAWFGITEAWTSSHGGTSGYLLLLIVFLSAVGPPDAGSVVRTPPGTPSTLR